MKFIRDIISERSDERPVPPKPLARVDRTMTRLSGEMLGDGDEVFKRLMGEDTPTEPSTAEISTDNLFDELETQETQSAAQADPTASDQLDTAALIRKLEADASAPEPEQLSLPTAHPPKPSFGGVPGRSARHALPPEPAPMHAEMPDTQPDAPEFVSVPAPASGRSGRGAGRVKTRLLGFGASDTQMHDPFADAAGAATPRMAQDVQFPVGWLVVIAGPGRGAYFPLQSGVSQIGRGDDQAVRLDFGDTAISRSNHAAIAYDAEQGGFYLGHGGKANMVRLNDKPVLSTEELHPGALIRIGETTLRFIAFCDDDFTWTQNGTSHDAIHG